MSAAARLAVVVLADRYAAIRGLVDRLRGQTVASALELVVVCPFRSAVEVPIDVRRALAGVVVVETPLLPLGVARAAGVRAATAPVVAFADPHAAPAADWAEHLLGALDGEPQAVAAGLRNANADGGLSWAGFLMDYGGWLAESHTNGRSEPPVAICAWRRDALLATGDRLTDRVAPGAVVDSGEAHVVHEPAATIAVLNVARLGPFASERYLRGRLYAAGRSRDWSIPGRLLCGLGFAVLPVLRLIRTQRAAASARALGRVPRMTLPAVVFGSVLYGLGEAVGYLAGPGRAETRVLDYELHKDRFAWRKL